jgi:hypothetical protein
MGVPEKSGPGPLPAIVGGVVAALVLFWLAGLVIGTVVFVVRIAVLVGLVAGGLWIWNAITGDD